MWEFYLAASETAFRWQDCVVFQVQLAKKVDRLPITRGYMAEAEEELRRKEKAADASDRAQAWGDRQAAE